MLRRPSEHPAHTRHFGLSGVGASKGIPRGGSMQHFLLFYDFVPDYLERRVPLRAEHLQYARAAQARGELVLGGALADPIDGAAILFIGENRTVAERFVAADPYVLNGLVTVWRIREWITVVGADATTVVP